LACAVGALLRWGIRLGVAAVYVKATQGKVGLPTNLGQVRGMMYSISAFAKQLVFTHI
jgi:hypothetical protein